MWACRERAMPPHERPRQTFFRADVEIRQGRASLWQDRADGRCDQEDETMKYMLMLYGDPALEPAQGTPEWDAMMQEFLTLADRMKDRATVLAGEGLLGVATATTLRRRDGRVNATDGPFAETREHLGGFFLIEAATLDDALAFAAEVPVIRWGAVEVRPVEQFE
jgi:hypothetical protein